MAHRFGSIAPGSGTSQNTNADDSDDEWSGPSGALSKNTLDLDSAADKPRYSTLASSSARVAHARASYADGRLDPVLNMPAPSDGSGTKIGTKFAQQVAHHYNLGAGQGKTYRSSRNNSRIIRLRSFNNWIKAVLLNEGLKIVKSRFDNLKNVSILDLACGKGGDIGKYDQLAQEFNIDHVTFVDISNDSIVDARKRYNSFPRSWKADFHVLDCAQDEFEKTAAMGNKRFHLVVCHFAVHYAFESFDRANVMLSNLCKPLFPAGVLILTTMNSFEVVRRLRDAAARSNTVKSSDSVSSKEKGKDDKLQHNGHVSLSNPVFRLEPKFGLNSIPLFCATYDFHLDEVVNLPEFLVHPGLLNSIAKKHFMLMDNNLSKQFPDLFERFSSVHHESYRNLLVRMGGLRRCMKRHFDEALGPQSMGNGTATGQGDGDAESSGSGVSGSVDADNDLVDPTTFLEQFRSAYTYFTQGPPVRESVAENDDIDGSTAKPAPAKEEPGKDESVGTLSRDEWEIVSLYSSFVFNKHPECVKFEQKEQPAETPEFEKTPRQLLLEKLGVRFKA